jgi:xanthine/uracil permease
LKYNPLGIGFFSLLLFVYLGVATLAICLTSDIWISRMSARASMLFWGVVGCCMWIPFGYFASHHLRKKSKLELKNS